MSFSGLRARIVDAVFGRLGGDAYWGNQLEPVRVRWREQDESGEFDRYSEIVRTTIILVRRSEVQAPAVGDVVVLLDAQGQPTGEEFRLLGEPRLTRNGVWRCEVEGSA